MAPNRRGLTKAVLANAAAATPARQHSIQAGKKAPKNSKEGAPVWTQPLFRTPAPVNITVFSGRRMGFMGEIDTG
jgi:hypothetical protein